MKLYWEDRSKKFRYLKGQVSLMFKLNTGSPWVIVDCTKSHKEAAEYAFRRGFEIGQLHYSDKIDGMQIDPSPTVEEVVR